MTFGRYLSHFLVNEVRKSERKYLDNNVPRLRKILFKGYMDYYTRKQVKDKWKKMIRDGSTNKDTTFT